MKSLFLNKKLKALTLTELLVVMVIIGILVLLALPNLMPLINQAKSQEAKINLTHIYKLQDIYRMEHSKFSDELTRIRFEAQKGVDEDGGQANYRYTIESATNTTFLAKATAITDFDGDGTFNVWQIDQDKRLEEIVPD